MNRFEVPVGAPCPAQWNAMVGDDLTRYCTLCHQEVHDLSARTAAEARRFLQAHPRACVRYTYDGHTGALLFRPTCLEHRVRRGGTLGVAIAASFATLLWAVFRHVPSGPAPERPVVMGGLEPPEFPLELIEGSLEPVPLPELPGARRAR